MGGYEEGGDALFSLGRLKFDVLGAEGSGARLDL